MSRSYFPDPTRQVVALVWPLCMIDMIAWKFYVGGVWGGIVCALYFLVVIGSIVYLKRTA